MRRQLELDHAWPIVAIGSAVSLLAAGMRFSIGPFMGPIVRDFGFSHTYFSSVVAVAMLLYGAAMPVAGWLADRWGSRPVLAAGSLLVSSSLFLTGLTRSPLLLVVTFAVLASLGFAATSHVVLAALISRWFRRHRGLAMTFLSAGTMGGIAVMTPLTAALIERIGWRETYLVFAASFAGLLLPAILSVVRERPPAEPLSGGAANRVAPGGPAGGAAEGSWREAMRTAPFWLLVVGFFGCGFSMNLLGTHGVPMLENHGFSAMTASFGIGLIGLVSIAGSLLMGIASDRLGRPVFLGLIYLVRGLGFLALLWLGQNWQLYTVAALGGLVWAGSSALTSAITADVYGPGLVGTLFGWIFLGHQVGGAIASYLGGWGFDTFGSYTLSFTVASGLLFLGAALSFRLAGWRLPPAAARPVPRVAAARAEG